MPIKWSAIQVSDAMDMVEEYVNQAAEPLEQARIVATEARKIPNLAQYVDQHILRLLGEIERVAGGVRSWNNERYEGSIKSAIASVRSAIPDGAVEAERAAERYGKTESMIPV